MKTVVAIFMGLCSAFLLSFMITLVLADVSGGDAAAGLLTMIAFVGGWVLSGWLLLRGAISVSKVFSRGFLLGAAEWLLMILVGLIFAGKAITNVDPASGAEAAGAAIGGGLVAMITGGVSIAMAVVCLIGFAVSHSLGKEMRKEVAAPTPTKKCPSCAELVQPEAIKCRYCGDSFAPA